MSLEEMMLFENSKFKNAPVKSFKRTRLGKENFKYRSLNANFKEKVCKNRKWRKNALKIFRCLR